MSATDCDGNKVSIPYPHELSGQDVHMAAARALLDKMQWKGELVGGGMKNGYAFVFVNESTLCAHCTEEQCTSDPCMVTGKQ